MKKESELTRRNRDIINCRANGKTIWQPRIECWYDDREFRGEQLPGKYKGASVLELYNRLGISKRLYEFCACLELHYDASIQTTETKKDALTTEKTIETPVGRVNCIIKGNTSNYGIMPSKWWVEDEADLKVYTYIEEHTNYLFNHETHQRLLQEWGHLGLPALFIPRINIQRLLLDLCGVENAIYLLTDSEALVEGYFEALRYSQLKMVDVLCDTPMEWINYGDNIHSKLITPSMFKKYVLPAYQERNERFHKAGKFTFAHFDGDIKDVLPYIQDTGLDGLEAVTPLPQGDVSLREAKQAMGDMFLVDGLAATLFDESYPLKMLQDQVKECLHLFEGQLILGISDEMASTGTLDRIEFVREMVEAFNSRH